MSLITRDDAGMITCVTATRMERLVLDHRGVRFELDTIGLDTWRWTILTDQPHGFRLIGQYRGKRDAAVGHCITTIDVHLARAASSPSPRLRGEGRGEGLYQTSALAERAPHPDR